VRGAVRWFILSVYFLAIVAGILSVFRYPGDKTVFALFGVVVFAIAAFAIRSPRQYAHFFLGIAWFLGFWVKYEFHAASGSSYFEPHGSFDGSRAGWDAVFLVVGIGGAGYLAGRLIALPVVGPATAALRRAIEVPAWWTGYRNLLWLAAGLLVLAMVTVNAEFGLFVRGYVAQVILPWPLGGLFAWLSEIGVALLLALFLAWDREAGFGISRGFVALCVESALFSISTLSRGVYFFHTLPPLITESAKEHVRNGRRPLALMIAIWVGLGACIPAATTALRLFGDNAVPTTQAQLVASRSGPITRSTTDLGLSGLWGHAATMAQLLVIDRWTGLEGVMATVAYPEKNLALMVEAAAKRRSYGTVDVYTGKISGSGFSETDAKTYHFATLAGPVAFFYFSGSLVLVFAGMAFLAVLVSAVELLWRWLVRDDLLIAIGGLYLALVVLQFSGGAIQAATGVVAATAVFAAIRGLILFSAGMLKAPQREPDQHDAGGKACQRNLT